MKNNPLFYFILDEIIQGKVKVDKKGHILFEDGERTSIKLSEFKVKKDGYILLELGGRISILNEAFDKQHIRFDEKFNNKETFTPYHYTARSQSRKKALHVYFTLHGKITSCWLDKDPFTLNSDENFIDHALGKISELRKLQEDKVSKLKDQYKLLEQEITKIESTSCDYLEKIKEIILILEKLKKYSEPVSSSGVPKFEWIINLYQEILQNKVSELNNQYNLLAQEIKRMENTSCGYLEKIKEIIPILEKLKKYSEPVSSSRAPKFERTIKWYQGILLKESDSSSSQKTIEQEKKIDYPIDCPEEELESHCDYELSSAQQKPSTRSFDILEYILSLKDRQEKLMQKEQTILDNLMNRKLVYLSNDDLQLVDDFVNLHNDVHNLVTNIEERSMDKITSEERQDITKLTRDVMSMGDKLFKRYLYMHAFFLARKLIGYLDNNLDFLFKWAIKGANAPVLDFLLTFRKEKFPINTFVINKDINPVEFCSARSKEVRYRRCLAVLIRHASSDYASDDKRNKKLKESPISANEKSISNNFDKKSHKIIRKSKFDTRVTECNRDLKQHSNKAINTMSGNCKKSLNGFNSRREFDDGWYRLLLRFGSISDLFVSKVENFYELGIDWLKSMKFFKVLLELKAEIDKFDPGQAHEIVKAFDFFRSQGNLGSQDNQRKFFNDYPLSHSQSKTSPMQHQNRAINLST